VRPPGAARSKDGGPEDPHMKEAVSYWLVAIGGLLGSVAALTIRPPASVREAASRGLAGIILAFALTGWTCELMVVHADDYHRVLAVGLGHGFVGWHLLSVLMLVLDGLVERAKVRGVGLLADLLAILRGKPTPKQEDDPRGN
jgi:uncharacterized membrane protein